MVVITVLAIIATHVIYGLDVRRSGYLMIPAACLIIVGVYRVVQTYTKNPSAAARSDAAFWVLQILFEL